MIIVRIWEGLGNQLFQYAYARTLQYVTGEQIYLDITHINREDLLGVSVNDYKCGLFDERKYKLNNFDIKLEEAGGKDLSAWNFLERKNVFQKARFKCSKYNFCTRHFLTDEPDTSTFHKDLLKAKGNCYISGHFFHKGYFEVAEHILHKELVLKKEGQIPEKLLEILQTCNTVSVHIRRGDFLNVSSFLGIPYYIRAFQYIKSKVAHPVFLFFSDDIQWVKKHLSGKDEYYFVSNGILEDYEELWIMSKCRHNIIANSTFSYWGAWLNQNSDKIVISPYHAISTMPEEWLIL